MKTQSGRRSRDPRDAIPDVRDGLTRPERVVLWVLHQLDQERGLANDGTRRRFSTAEIYGRVVEHVDLSVDELQSLLVRLGAGDRGPR